MRKRVVILGAAGRDFHNFNCVYRDNDAYEVVAFTAAQIPDIADRKYPPEIAGALYPAGIPIVEESSLPELIRSEKIDDVVFSYSDISHEDLMHKASIVTAEGANFMLLGPRFTTLAASKPVVSITAVRTGCGKSPTSRKVARLLKEMGQAVVVVRHPMPYGDLREQVCQRFATLADLAAHDCTIEEMEEYEPHLNNGVIVYAGVDYQRILNEAEREAEVIVWDGGNNDTPFFKPDLDLVVTDPHRPNHEMRYYPGETNFRRAQCLVITKLDSATPENLRILEQNISRFNPVAAVIRANLSIHVEDEAKIRGKRVLVVEDGPTLTHGEMSFGAGVVAADRFGAASRIDPRPYLTGSLRDTFDEYPAIRGLLPAMGYGQAQISDLEATINSVPCDTVLIATPIDLRRVCNIKHDTCRVLYDLDEIGTPDLHGLLRQLVG